MKFVIKSKNYGDVSFFMPNDGGYVRLESEGKMGTFGKQICSNGDFSGNTIIATPETFERVCKRWHKQHMTVCNEYDIEYGN